MHYPRLLFFLLLALLPLLSATAQRGVYAITNTRIETVSNGAIERGTIVLRDGRIEAVGASVSAPSDATVIDGTGMTVYPGMIDSGTSLGTVEISSFARARDNREIGTLTPHVAALTAVNPNSVLIPVTRVSGVTTALTEPAGGLLPGEAALINLHGYTPAQMHVGGVRVMRMNYPVTGRRGWWDSRTDKKIKEDDEAALDQLNDVFDRARLYHRIDSAYTADNRNPVPDFIPEMRAMLPVVRGEMPLVITANRAKDIEAALAWIAEQDLENVIFSGVAEGWRVADQIAAAGIPCLVGPVLSIPTRGSDRYDRAYANAGLLHQAGVKVAIRTGEAENVRNLPFNAGFAAAYGLGREAALRAITLAPAEIFGVADHLGSLEAGKQATLFVSDGDPFETKTTVHHVFIDGYQIPMESRHTRLYDEFLNRDPGAEEGDK